jgi:hypothetical protein
VEWERAVPVSVTGQAPPRRYRGGTCGRRTRRGDPPPAHAAAAGHTDAAIARGQGRSERTTQRRIQRVMAQLGAPTRFRAGLLATRRGRLRP